MQGLCEDWEPGAWLCHLGSDDIEGGQNVWPFCPHSGARSKLILFACRSKSLVLATFSLPRAGAPEFLVETLSLGVQLLLRMSEENRSAQDMAGNELSWDDTEEIGIALCKQHPGIEPEKVALREVHRLATLLPGFKGDPGDYNEGKLQAIRGAWTMEFLDRTQ
jgi:FeS assembly protein IscX